MTKKVKRVVKKEPEFAQPTLEEVADLDGNELAKAVAQANAPKPVAPVAPPPPAKFALEYSIMGDAIRETHATLAHAVSRDADLKRMGIVPKLITLKK